MVFVRLGGPDLLRGSFAGSFAGVCARDSRFYSVAAVQSVRFEARRSRKSAPGRLRGAIFPSLFDPRRKQGHAFFSNRFRIHFLRLFCHFFWKFGDPQIPKSTLLDLKRSGILKFHVFFRLVPFFKKVCFFCQKKKVPAAACSAPSECLRPDRDHYLVYAAGD